MDPNEIWSWWLVEWNVQEGYFEIHKLAAALEMNKQAREAGEPARPCLPEALLQSLIDAKAYVKARRLDMAVKKNKEGVQDDEVWGEGGGGTETGAGNVSPAE